MDACKSVELHALKKSNEILIIQHTTQLFLCKGFLMGVRSGIKVEESPNPYLKTNSTRRLSILPSSLVLLALGEAIPTPTAVSRLAST